MRPLPRPKAVLFDLFHTLVSVPSAELSGEPTVAAILGVSAAEFHRCYYDDDVLGRCLGHVQGGVEAMRRVARMIDASVAEDRIAEAVENRRRRFTRGLVDIERPILAGLDRLRAVGMQSVLVTRLIERPTPEKIAARRAHADWEFEDVAGFVDALMAAAATATVA